MELLLIAACAWLVYQSGAQSEQSKLGVSPAQREHMRENTRHEKAVRRIAEKHKDAPVAAGSSAGAGKPDHSVPDTFGSGYRSTRPARPPLGARAGEWTGRGVTWAQHTGRDAWQAYRKRRKDAGEKDPGPVLVPIPPARPPDVPPVPAEPPTAGSTDGKDGATPKPAEEAPPAAPAEAPPKPSEAPKEAPEKTQPIDLEKAPKPDGDEAPDTPVEPAAADTDDPAQPEPEEVAPAPPPAAEAEAPRPDTTPPADTPQGAGRMAAQVTYESVEDESDDLSAMCEEDIRAYDRVRSRSEREVSRGDELIAKLQGAGFGSKVIGWVTRCKEQYEVIRGQVGDLQKNTMAQKEKVIEAKDLLIKGQGVYAAIAKDMEDVADRESYISDAVDAEDANAGSEVYETRGVS